MKASSSSSPQPTMKLELPEVPVEIMKACEQIVATSIHNSKEALKQANELCSKHGNFPVVYLTRGQVLELYCSNLLESDKNKRKYLKEAINSHKRAVEMLPDSPLYSVHLAEAMFQLAKLNHADYDKVIQECDRGLSLDALNEIPRMTGRQRDQYVKLKAHIERLMSDAKAAQDVEDLEYLRRFHPSQQRKINIRKNDRKREWNQESVRKISEYWRRLSYDEKCRKLDVNVKDIKDFYQSGKNKNLKALSILMEAVDMYRKKGLWETWTCCYCKEGRKKEDYNVWDSLHKHLDNHFDDVVPNLKGPYDYQGFAEFESIEITNGVFVLHQVLDRQGINSDTYNAPILNNVFLWHWLAHETDIESLLEKWENRSVQRTASMIFEKTVRLIEDMKITIEQHEQAKHEAAEDMQNVSSDNVGRLEKEIMTLKREVVCLCVRDYRQIMLPLLKYFIQARLECEAERQARIEADANMAELVKDESPKNKNVPIKPKNMKKMRDNKKSPNREDSKSHIQHEVQAPSMTQEEESPDTDVHESIIYFGSFPVTLKTQKNKLKEIAPGAVEHPPEYVDDHDSNEGWVRITP